MSSKNATLTCAHFDCQFGAAGDMLVAALLDAGVDRDKWLSEVQKISLPAGSFHVRWEKVNRCSISATKIDIDLGEDAQQSSTQSHLEHDHAHEFNPTFSNEPRHLHSRHLSQILTIIRSSDISEKARNLSSRIFNRLARAEAQVHGIDPEDVHFHEVGAVDAIVDIVGFAIAFDLAGIESATATPSPLGTGVVKTEHGLFPIPAPAVLKLLQEVSAPSSGFAVPFECLTPTGAAILCEICQSWGSAPEFDQIKMSGYGAGSKNPARWSNVVRVMLGTQIATNSSSRFASETISVLEANIDDQSPQALAFAVEKIIAAGALDAIVLPATMKKSRSGHLLSVLCKPEDQVKFQEMIICETSSIGVRAVSMNRLLADRHFADLSMDGDHTIRMKLASDKSGKVINAQAEFDDLAKYAMIKDITIKEAQAAAFEAYKRQLAANNGDDADKLALRTEDL